MNPRFAIAISLVTMAILAFWASTMCVAYTDRAFICENTGSRHGYREWFSGMRTGQWRETTELERFMRIRHPQLLTHRWTSYRGDGHSLIPCLQIRGHGRPGPIHMLRPAMLNDHVARLTDAEKPALYQIFASGEASAIQAMVDEIHEHPRP